MRNNDGFVLVEVLMDGLAVGALLVVVTLMAVQSAITLPRWSESRSQSHLTAVRLEAENLYARQALHLADAGTYAVTLDELGFDPSPGLRVGLAASPSGWSATLTHSQLDPSQGCAVYVGSALPPHGPVSPPRPGRVTCTNGGRTAIAE